MCMDGVLESTITALGLCVFLSDLDWLMFLRTCCPVMFLSIRSTVIPAVRRLKFGLPILVMIGCSATEISAPEGADPASATAPAAGPPPALVRVRPVRRETIAPEVRAMGTVRPRHFSVVASAADGIVDTFLHEQGDFVKRDTVLSTLRMLATDLALDEQRAVLKERQADYEEMLKPREEDVREAVARLQAAEVSLANSERRLKELQSLERRGAGNSSSVEEAELHAGEARQLRDAAKAMAERVRAGVREEQKQQAKARLEAQEKHVAFLEAERDKRITLAPFDGFVVTEHTNVGQYLAKGLPVVTMAQLDMVDVEVQVDESFVSQVAPGDTVRVRVSGAVTTGHPDGVRTGTIAAIVPKSDWEEGSRSFPVIIRLTNEMNGDESSPVPVLREGMTAEVNLSGSQREAVLVPKDALVRTSRGTFVFAVNPEEAGKPTSVRQVMVTTGISHEQSIQVTDCDLKDGDQVVTEGAERLRPFQSINILPEGTAEDSAAPE
ncbi:MAG: efflux RND transporter periplasmic adaptor subunit [Planctomycetaceae bacterium]|nr:efflux RND transporter periplasmic adaptor subunit [Planctomycetaceae bacterium]